MEFPTPRATTVDVPADATDCHMHVFGPADHYPPSPDRTYTPPPATLDQYRGIAAALRLTRHVVVQPSAYGVDNACTLDAVAAIGPSARAVIGLDPTIVDDELDRMHTCGARGIRVNAASAGLRDVDEIAGRITAAAGRVARLGWHVQIFTDLTVIERLVGCFRSLPVPVVVDHMGLANAALGSAQPGLVMLCDLLASGRCWVKLSGAYRISVREPGFADAEPIARALIDANSDRVVWGTDWPHAGSHGHVKSADAPALAYRPLDTAALLEQLVSCAGSAATTKKILVDNPARLYGF